MPKSILKRQFLLPFEFSYQHNKNSATVKPPSLTHAGQKLLSALERCPLWRGCAMRVSLRIGPGGTNDTVRLRGVRFREVSLYCYTKKTWFRPKNVPRSHKTSTTFIDLLHYKVNNEHYKNKQTKCLRHVSKKTSKDQKRLDKT